MPEKMRDFSTISTVKVSDVASWNKGVFLTFDIDCAHDEVLNEPIEIFKSIKLQLLGL